MGTPAPDGSSGAGCGFAAQQDLCAPGPADAVGPLHRASGAGGPDPAGDDAAGKAGAAGQDHPVSGAGRLFRHPTAGTDGGA